jgi:nitroimidazol reductase NimA-like FMN-containing flavoprotein (pyridoxamine 5'-phosphate oxidase superfamily)
MSADSHRPSLTHTAVDADEGSERAASTQTTGTFERPSPQLVELTRAECLSLLAATGFGRVAAIAGRDRPMIRPVNYAFDGPSQSVVFRTNDGTKFHAIVRSTRASFEIDRIDAKTRTGWSVIITGVTEEVTRPSEIARLERLGLDPWAPGSRPHWIRLAARIVSGRRIVSATTHAQW